MRIETIPELSPTHEDAFRFAHHGDGDAALAPVRAWKERNREPLDQLTRAAQQSDLEVRVQTIPGSHTIILRFVDPASGRVVQEFPSERLAQALHELQAQIAGSDGATFDRRA